MLSISHAVTGAFIAVKVGNPLLAVPLILLAHYLEDAIPHWDAGTGLSRGVKTPGSAFRHEIIDILLAGLLVLVFFPDAIPHILNSKFYILNWSPIWGAFLGLFPDFLVAPRNFWKYEPPWLKSVNRFHGSFHHSIPRPLDGLAPQILLLALLWFLR